MTVFHLKHLRPKINENKHVVRIGMVYQRLCFTIRLIDFVTSCIF